MEMPRCHCWYAMDQSTGKISIFMQLLCNLQLPFIDSCFNYAQWRNDSFWSKKHDGDWKSQHQKQGACLSWSFQCAIGRISQRVDGASAISADPTATATTPWHECLSSYLKDCGNGLLSFITCLQRKAFPIGKSFSLHWSSFQVINDYSTLGSESTLHWNIAIMGRSYYCSCTCWWFSGRHWIGH